MSAWSSRLRGRQEWKFFGALPRADAPLAVDYKLFVHVAGADGVPVAQWDGYPRWNTARTSTWAPGVEVVDHLLLPLPDDLPPGDYRLLTGLYDPATGARLGDQAVDLGALTVR